MLAEDVVLSPSKIRYSRRRGAELIIQGEIRNQSIDWSGRSSAPAQVDDDDVSFANMKEGDDDYVDAGFLLFSFFVILAIEVVSFHFLLSSLSSCSRPACQGRISIALLTLLILAIITVFLVHVSFFFLNIIIILLIISIIILFFFFYSCSLKLIIFLFDSRCFLSVIFFFLFLFLYSFLLLTFLTFLFFSFFVPLLPLSGRSDCVLPFTIALIIADEILPLLHLLPSFSFHFFLRCVFSVPILLILPLVFVSSSSSLFWSSIIIFALLYSLLPLLSHRSRCG